MRSDKYSLTQILTVDQTWNVQFEDILGIWSACANEYAIHGIEDHFCSVFTLDQFKILAAYFDLEAYYEKGW